MKFFDTGRDRTLKTHVGKREKEGESFWLYFLFLLSFYATKGDFFFHKDLITVHLVYVHENAFLPSIFWSVWWLISALQLSCFDNLVTSICPCIMPYVTILVYFISFFFISWVSRSILPSSLTLSALENEKFLFYIPVLGKRL